LAFICVALALRVSDRGLGLVDLDVHGLLLDYYVGRVNVTDPKYLHCQKLSYIPAMR